MCNQVKSLCKFSVIAVENKVYQIIVTKKDCFYSLNLTLSFFLANFVYQSINSIKTRVYFCVTNKPKKTEDNEKFNTNGEKGIAITQK